MATILIVDDRPPNRDYLVTLLGYFGHRLVEAANGEEGLELARSERPDLVISDLLMPIIDGQELAERMRADPALSQIPILFYSAMYSLRQAQAVARQVGAIDVLPKPGDPETILAMVDRALSIRRQAAASRPPLSQTLSRELAELEVIAQKLPTPIEMSLELGAERHPSKLLLGLARTARELIGSTYSAVGLLNEDRDHISVVLSSGAGRPEGDGGGVTMGDPKTYPAPPRDSILGGLLTHGGVVVLNNVQTAHLQVEIPGCSFFHSFLAVPLMFGVAPRGWLFLANKLAGEDFTDGDARVISRLATLGAATYEKVLERLRSEEELQQSKAMFESLFEAAPDAMVATDRQGVIRFANLQTEAMFRYSPQELIGRPIESLLPDRFHRDHPRLRESYQNMPRRRPMGLGMELYAKRKDGTEFPVDIMLSPMAHSEDGLVLSVVRDITQRKESERKIIELNEQLQVRVEELQAANQSLEAFSYSVSHDLRAPLRAIDGFARILSEEHSEQLDPEAQRLLGVISANCQKMGKLIEDLLAFSRVSRGTLMRSEMDMTAIAQSVADDLLALEPSRQIEITVRRLPPALGDRNLLRQVFINLISNAWKFTRQSAAPTIEVGSYRQDDALVYFVKDNGVGFDPQYSDKLFGIFQRLHSDNEFEGTGIGLALVRRIVERHGGKVWAASKLGEGATFSFTLEHAAL